MKLCERMAERVTMVLAAMSLMSLAVTAAEAPNAAEPTVAKLEHFEPAALFLKTPEGLQGNFTVAREAPAVDFAVFPGQWETKDLWSAWGDSLHASDGKFYASIGDHAAWGTTFVYEVDPSTKKVRLAIDVNKALGLTRQDYAAGKIHAPIIDRGDGWLYVVNYPGTVPGPDSHYKGDRFFRYEMASGNVESLGVLVPGSGEAVLEYFGPSNILYGLSEGYGLEVEPRNKFFVYDLEARKFIYHGGPEPGMTRALMLAADGRAYYGGKDKMLMRYDPKEKTVSATNQQIPGDGSLRAVSRPASDGVLYALSADGVVFAFDPESEQITWSARAFTESSHYITTCRLDPTERYLYYVPDAHGSAWKVAAPLIQFDLETKKPKVLAFLNEFFVEEKGYNLGGTYGIALNAEGSQLFICWNGSPVGETRQQGFGLCSAMIVHIPESERRAAP